MRTSAVRIQSWLAVLVLSIASAAKSTGQVTATPTPYVAAPQAVSASHQSKVAQLRQIAATRMMWPYMQRNFAIPHLDSDEVLDQMRWMISRPSSINQALERGAPFLSFLTAELERRGMPIDLAVLPVIESAFEARATSPAAAAGVWQFIPSTGRRFGLVQQAGRDDRREMHAASIAAFNYLAELFTLFGDWHLALAAYNCGEGCVARAALKAQQAGYGLNFMGIRPFLPAETQAYVPKFMAVRNVILGAQQYGHVLPTFAHALSPVRLDRSIDLAQLAVHLNLAPAQLQQWNPTQRAGVLPAFDQTYLWVPTAMQVASTRWVAQAASAVVPATTAPSQNDWSPERVAIREVGAGGGHKVVMIIAGRPTSYDPQLDTGTAQQVQGRLRQAHRQSGTPVIVRHPKAPILIGGMQR